MIFSDIYDITRVLANDLGLRLYSPDLSMAEYRGVLNSPLSLLEDTKLGSIFLYFGSDFKTETSKSPSNVVSTTATIYIIVRNKCPKFSDVIELSTHISSKIVKSCGNRNIGFCVDHIKNILDLAGIVDREPNSVAMSNLFSSNNFFILSYVVPVYGNAKAYTDECKPCLC